MKPNPIRVVLGAIFTTIALIACGAIVASAGCVPVPPSEAPEAPAGAAVAQPVLVQHAQAPQRPTIYVLLVTVMTGDGKLLARSQGPYSSLELCRARAQAEMQDWARKRAMDVTPACAALFVTQRMVDDLVAQEREPASAPEEPVNHQTRGLTI